MKKLTYTNSRGNTVNAITISLSEQMNLNFSVCDLTMRLLNAKTADMSEVVKIENENDFDVQFNMLKKYETELINIVK